MMYRGEVIAGTTSQKKENEMNTRLMPVLVVLMAVLPVHSALAALGGFEYVTLDVPGATQTEALGVDGNKAVGLFRDNEGWHGFLYDIPNQTFVRTLDAPPAENTFPRDIDGSRIVGSFNEGSGPSRGFLYDDVTRNYTTLDVAGATEGTHPRSIGGNMIVGFYTTTGPASQGFVATGNPFQQIEYSFLEVPGSQQTWPSGIDGNNIVGWFRDSSDINHSFLYDGTDYTTLEVEGFARNIDGDMIVGSVNVDGDWHGFVYDIVSRSSITLNVPSAESTQAWGIDGDNVVGHFTDATGVHGFLLTIPEPTTAALLIVLALGVRRG